MFKSLVAKAALGVGVLVVGGAAYVWFRPPAPLQHQLVALGDTHVQYVAPIKGKPMPGQPGYVIEKGKKQPKATGPAHPGWQYNSNYVPNPYTGPLPTIAYGPAKLEAPGFQYKFLANPPETYSLGSSPLMAPGAAQAAEEATLADMTNNLPALVSLTDRSPREVSSLTSMVESNSAPIAAASLVIYSIQMTGVSIDPVCTENMPAPGAEPCWNVSYKVVFTGSGYKGKAVLTGTLTVATGLKPPAGAILMKIVGNTNSVTSP